MPVRWRHPLLSKRSQTRSKNRRNPNHGAAFSRTRVLPAIIEFWKTRPPATAPKRHSDRISTCERAILNPPTCNQFSSAPCNRSSAGLVTAVRAGNSISIELMSATSSGVPNWPMVWMAAFRRGIIRDASAAITRAAGRAVAVP